MDPKIEQVVPKVVLKKESAAGAAPTPAEALAKKLIEQSTADQWREAQKGFKKEIPIDARVIAQKAEQIGIERDATGAKVRTPEEQGRYDSFKTSAELNKKFLEQGYDKLSGAQKTELANFVKDSLNSNPLLATEFNALPAADQNEAIIKILKDAKYSPHLREAVNAILDSDQKMIDDKEIDDKGYGVKEKEYKKTEEQNAINDLDAKITSLGAELRKFERSPAGTAVGASAVELDGLRTNRATTETELQTHKSNLEDVKADLQNLMNEKQMTLRYGAGNGRRDGAAIDTDITNKRTEIRDEQREVDTREKSIRRIAELELQEATLKEGKTKAEKERRDKDISFRKADLEWSKSKRDFEDLKKVRVTQEEDLVNKMKNTFTEAADAYLADGLKVGIDNYDKEIESRKAQASDQNEKAMYDAFREKWRGPERTRRVGVLGFRKEERYRPISKTEVDADFGILKSSGPEALMKRLLMSRTNPATGANYTDTEATALFANKTEGSLYKKMEAESVIQLLTSKLKSGGISVEDSDIIFNSQWGKDAIEKSIDRNKSYHAQIEKMMGEKVLINPGFTERVGQLARKRPWLLYSLLGIPALLIGAAGSETIKDFNLSR